LNGALIDVVLRDEERSEEVNLIGVCGGLSTDCGASRFSCDAWKLCLLLDEIGLDLFGLVQFGSGAVSTNNALSLLVQYSDSRYKQQPPEGPL
jgi:hypothetical protein